VLAEFFLTSQNGISSTFFLGSYFDHLTAIGLARRKYVLYLPDWLPFELRGKGEEDKEEIIRMSSAIESVVSPWI
jgi:hypothetical protein